MDPQLLLTTLGGFALGAAVVASTGRSDAEPQPPDRAQIHGIGGIFFTSDDPAATRDWYVTHLGITELTVDGGFKIPLIQWRELDRPDDVGSTVFGVFPKGAEHLAPTNAEFMINFRVRDIEAVRRQVEAGGGKLLGEIEDDFNGRFAWFLDPDGRKVELWEPAEGY
jgi:catechol 2,3-dioxygenase-like lactoylglutathione lyase family enzyme